MGVPDELKDAHAIEWDDDLFIYCAENYPEEMTLYVSIEWFIQTRARMNAVGWERVNVVASPKLEKDQTFTAFPRRLIEERRAT